MSVLPLPSSDMTTMDISSMKYETGLRQQAVDSTSSLAPRSKPSISSRPKLLLQTDNIRIRQTGYDCTQDTGANDQGHYLSRSVSSISFSTIPRSTSSPPPAPMPFPMFSCAPYVLTFGTHSILRNTPLQQNHVPAKMVQVSRSLYPPAKHVRFQEKTENIISSVPTEEMPDPEGSVSPTQDEQ